MKNKGFTLIELLAVILILGIIALIAIPSVSTVVEQSAKGSFELSANNLVSEVEKKCTSSVILGAFQPNTYYIVDGKVEGLSLDITGKLPKEGTIIVDNKCNVSINATDENDKYIAIKTPTDERVTVYLKNEAGEALERFNVVPVNETAEDTCFLYEDNSSGITITGYKFSDNSCSRDIVIPTSIGGKNVTKLKEFAFASNPLVISAFQVNQDNQNYSNAVYQGQSIGYKSGADELAVYTNGSTITKTSCYNNGPSIVATFDGVYEKQDNDGYYFCTYSVTNNDSGIVSINSIDFSHAKYLTTIPDGLAARTSLKSINIGNYITEIGKRAFAYNDISTLSIPTQLTKIGAGAFANNNLTSLNLRHVEELGSGAFLNNPLLESVNFGDKLKYIPKFGFDSCGLINVNIPSGVTRVEQYAFIHNSINNLNISGTVKLIGAYAFAGSNENPNVSTLTLGEGVERIGQYAFMFSNLQTVSLPNSFINLGSYVFAGSSNLTSVNLNKLVTLNSGAFIQTGLTSLTIPDTVTFMGSHICADCSKLTSVTIGNGVTELNGFLFRNTKITKIDVPSSVTTIGTETFQQMGTLRTLNIPSSVTSIGNYALYGLQTLTVNIDKPSGSITGAPWGAKNTVVVNWLG